MQRIVSDNTALVSVCTTLSCVSLLTVNLSEMKIAELEAELKAARKSKGKAERKAKKKATLAAKLKEELDTEFNDQREAELEAELKAAREAKDLATDKAATKAKLEAELEAKLKKLDPEREATHKPERKRKAVEEASNQEDEENVRSKNTGWRQRSNSVR